MAADHPVAFRMAGLALILARDLDRQLDRLGTRIVEEYGVGEAVGDKPLGQALLPRDLEQVRAVPELLGLFGHRLDHVRMTMAERGDGDAAGEIEKFAAVGVVKIEAFAPFD